jgi:hypothetical protein
MKLVIDSGATSNFVPKEMNLLKKGKPNNEVYLPDNTELQASYKNKLPFEQLTNKAREADIIPGVNIGLVHYSTHMSLTLARLCGEWQLVSGNCVGVHIGRYGL